MALLFGASYGAYMAGTRVEAWKIIDAKNSSCNGIDRGRTFERMVAKFLFHSFRQAKSEQERFMSPPPTVLGVTLCERVIVEEGTRSVTLVSLAVHFPDRLSVSA
jgi:hypothetical protein